MRKVLSFVLVLSLVLGSFAMAFAADPLSDMAGEKSEDAVNVLTQLGVVSGYPDGTYRPDNIVTRAEMAVIVVRALGLADYATGTSRFSDMGGHWSNPYVAYAANLGIVAGYTDGTFRPDKTVSYDEAATMLVAALGYNAESLVGTWPANFVVKAKSLGILDGIKAGAAGANRGDIAIMAFQTLDQAIGTTNRDGDWTAINLGTVTNPVDDTMLSRLGAELYDPGTGAGDAFVLTQDIAEDAVANVKAYLGAYVTAYANDDGDIIAIKDVKSTFLTGNFGRNGALTGQSKFEADRDYDIRNLGDVATEYFQNGEDINTLALNSNTEYKIAAKVSGIKIDAVYSVSEWEVSNAGLFEDGDLDEDSLLGEDFALDDNDEVDFKSFELVGVDSLDDIDEDNVVYVYVGPDSGEITRVAVGTEVVEGEVTRITSSGSKVTVNGTVYELANNDFANDADWDELDIDDEVAFYLDYAGYVFDIEAIDSKADQYAIILNVESATADPITGKNALVELFLADGTVKVFDVEKDADEDGTILNANGIWQNAASLPGTLVEYGLDSDGVIDVITEVIPDETDAEGEVTSRGYFDGKAVVSDVIVFTVDTKADPDDDSDITDYTDKDTYGVLTLANITGKEYDKVDYLHNDNNRITLMVIYGEGGSGDEVYGLITGKYRTSASDSGYMATVLVDGAAVDYEVSSQSVYNNLSNSEVLYELKLNARDQITGLVAVDTGSATDADLLKAGFIDRDYLSGTVGVDAVRYTVDSNAIAYKWDDGEFVKSTVSRSNLRVGEYVILYDLDDDKVVDVILIGITDDEWIEALEDYNAAVTTVNRIFNDGNDDDDGPYTTSSWDDFVDAYDDLELDLTIVAGKAALESEIAAIETAIGLLVEL